MKELLKKVEKELEAIGDKGLSSSNLETTYKLIDIYKDIKEACYYEDMVKGDSYDARSRDSRGRYNETYYPHTDYTYNTHPLNEREERYLERIRDGIRDYNEGRNRYRDGDSKQRMIDGVDMAMGALANFVEYMMDYAETNQEKDVIRKYIDKMKNL